MLNVSIRRFQPGEGHSRDLPCDCATSNFAKVLSSSTAGRAGGPRAAAGGRPAGAAGRPRQRRRRQHRHGAGGGNMSA